MSFIETYYHKKNGSLKIELKKNERYFRNDNIKYDKIS